MSSAAPLARLLGVAPPAPPPAPPLDPDAIAHAAREEGFAAAMQQAEAILTELEAAHRLALAAAEARAAALIEAAAGELAGAARALARAVLSAEPQVPAGTIAALARDVMEAAPEAGVLAFNPEDLALLPGVPPEGWTWQPDPAVPPGEVRGACAAGLFVAALARRAEALLGAGAAA